MNYATFLEYENPYFKPNRHRISVTPLKRRNRKVRLCLVQSGFSPSTSYESLLTGLTALLEEAESLGSQLILLPDGWCHVPGPESRQAEFAEFLAAQCRRLGLFVVGGVCIRDEAPVAMYTSSGELGRQSRIHPQGQVAGSFRASPELLLFDTSLGRIGVLIGYDIVFPEIARRLALAGMQLLLCPISSTERNDYLRLRCCAQARAIENSVFVALCNGAHSRSYGESVIFTPCDFGFPDSGIAARAGTFGPTFVVHDLDFGSLDAVREIGEVRPLKDRRIDFCGLSDQVRVRTVKQSLHFV